MKYKFEWDAGKAASNVKKHDVSFEQAITVFWDPLAAVFHDYSHSQVENRELIIGHSLNGLLMVVSFTERSAGIIRLISARPATRREKKDYEEIWINR